MDLQKVRGMLWYLMLNLAVLVFLGDVFVQYDMIRRNHDQAQQIHVLQRAVQSDTDEIKRLQTQAVTTDSQNKAQMDQLKKQIQSASKKSNAAF